MSADQDVWTPRLAAGTGQPGPPEVRVRFGELPNQSLPLEWAELFLAIIYAEYPQVFVRVLPRLYGLPEPSRRGRRPA